MLNRLLPTQKKDILPDFIIIGAQKSGTTSLHFYLHHHPEISMSYEKELDFFLKEKNWTKGIEWYKSQFKGDAKIYGESSPNYTNYPIWTEAPQYMYEVVPNAKLIYLESNIYNISLLLISWLYLLKICFTFLKNS